MVLPNANMVDETQTLNTSQHEHKTEAQGGEIYGGSSGKLWSMYLAEIEKQDKEMAERWKGEADSALIFQIFKAGLFSAVVSVSLVESYKWLSPDPGNETVKLLTQISQQLVNISNGIPLESTAAEISQPFKPTSSALMVNIMWFGSIVLCLACSVFATLIQQRARRYLALTQGRGTPFERARLRTFMFNGLRRFKGDQISQVLTMALHLSILLYCVGLLGYIFSIDTRIGFAALGYLSMFYLIYTTLTALPVLSIDCPYGTPFSALMWRISHVFLLGFFATIRRIEDLFHVPLSTLWNWTYRDESGLESGSRGPAKWKKMLEKRVNTYRQRFLDGLQRSIEFYATEVPQAVDANTLEWTLTALVENNSEKEIEGFAAWVPEFFDTCAPSSAPEAIRPLMSDHPPTIPIFGFRLHHLLEACIIGTSDLPEEERKRRLRVCLKCLWCWVREYNQHSMPLPSYFPLPDPDMTQRLQTEEDPTAGMIGRCFSALVAKKLAADVNSRHSSDDRVRKAKLASLSAILGMEVTSLSQPGAIGLANIVSLTSNGMNTLVSEKVSREVLGIFQRTIDILLAEDLLISPDAGLPQNLVDSFHGIYSNAPEWLKEKLEQISKKLSQGPSPYLRNLLLHDRPVTAPSMGCWLRQDSDWPHSARRIIGCMTIKYSIVLNSRGVCTGIYAVNNESSSNIKLGATPGDFTLLLGYGTPVVIITQLLGTGGDGSPVDNLVH
ncbi:hypothetical protein BJY52DRAFT_1413490 [Lactarius psammicola]|nr:hypothetical protein BJY52DRAFT_1413490 [Lactarius psammicola]